MNFIDTDFPIKARTNDDFNIHIDTGFSITGHIPKFAIKKQDGTIIDLSTHCSVVSDTAFTISISADVVKASIGALKAPYDMIIDKGTGSKEFLFSGTIVVTDGFS